MEGELVVSGPLGRGRVFVSGSVTPESAAGANAPHGLADALKALTAARYGRTEKLDSNVDDAVATAIRDHQAATVGALDGVGMGPQLHALGRRSRRKVWA